MILKTTDILKEDDIEVKFFLIWLGAESYELDTEMIWNSGKNGILNLLAVQNFKDFSAIKDLDLSRFEYRISTKTDKEELLAFGYPYSQIVNLELDSVNAVYYNASKLVTFKPYCISKEENE